jgi:hypothetical protein
VSSAVPRTRCQLKVGFTVGSRLPAVLQSRSAMPPVNLTMSEVPVSGRASMIRPRSVRLTFLLMHAYPGRVGTCPGTARRD